MNSIQKSICRFIFLFDRERGVAIIINNEEFESRTGMGSRTGSSVDRDNLQKVLKFVGFKDIRVKNNLKQKDMIRLMEDGMCSILIAKLLLANKVFFYRIYPE